MLVPEQVAALLLDELFDELELLELDEATELLEELALLDEERLLEVLDTLLIELLVTLDMLALLLDVTLELLPDELLVPCGADDEAVAVLPPEQPTAAKQTSTTTL
jgi:hypothetical protein